MRISSLHPISPENHNFFRNLEHYCIKNIKNVIGASNFNTLRGMFMDTDPVEQIETKFHELVAELSEERERLLAG